MADRNFLERLQKKSSQKFTEKFTKADVNGNTQAIPDGEGF